MAKTIFIAGTDTEVGKTLVAAGMLYRLREQGLSTVAIKPVAAGAQDSAEGSHNEDGLMLQRYQTARLSYQQVNPVLLAQPLSPHIAAHNEGRRVTVNQLVGYCRGVMMQPADIVVIEGAGGWRTPINASETLAALPRELNIPCVLVVGMRLGCLNHALLTAEAMARDGVPLLGWVANLCEPNMAEVEANLATLQQQLPGQFLGFVPRLTPASPESLAPHLDLSALLG